MVRRSTQPNANTIALAHKFLRKSKDTFLESIMEKTGLTYAQFMEKAKKIPSGNYLELAEEENSAAIQVMTEIMEEMETTIDIMRRQL